MYKTSKGILSSVESSSDTRAKNSRTQLACLKQFAIVRSVTLDHESRRTLRIVIEHFLPCIEAYLRSPVVGRRLSGS